MIDQETLRAARPSPRAANERDREFWEGCARGELHVQLCGECGLKSFPAQERCPRCQARAGTWTPVENTGTLYSFVVIHGPGTEGRPPGFEDAYPYAVALVEIDGGEGSRIAGNLVGVSEEEIEIGMRVEAVFGEGPALPEFVPMPEVRDDGSDGATANGQGD